MDSNGSGTPRAMRGNIPVTNLYTAGVAGERFFRALQKKGELLGTRCNACNVSYLPARHFCERCFARLEEYIPAPGTGTVATFTISHRDLDDRPLPEPVPVALIRFEGFEGGLVHRLGGVEASAIRTGMRVEPVLAEAKKRTGGINDILHFKPAGRGK